MIRIGRIAGSRAAIPFSPHGGSLLLSGNLIFNNLLFKENGGMR